ncbi:exocyst complex component Sec3-domain-containing protein [Irpex rosettiformis]|uniref:Exocyst complex component Sec3-domain-containing protein n=1 Tax=Irpex rosettiformis TaxID=378272 RepID=A0ACB8TTT9_9APHY|nr:exocyst complex component Sec3-domain-containing protein [Irpex rosettiformis]
MADYASVRQRIISSVFSKLGANGHQETYVAHVKIWEDVSPEEGGKKPRYIIIARSSDGTGSIHKSKLNSNGSFSVGKTWKLGDLRGVEVINPLAFSITLSRTYRWQTEDEKDQANFVVSLIRLHSSITNGAPLRVVGVRDGDVQPASRTPAQPQPPAFMRMDRAPTPPSGIPIPPATPRRPYANGNFVADSSQSRVSQASQFSSSGFVPAIAPAPRPASRPRRGPSPPRRPNSPESQAYTATVVPERSSTPVNRPRPSTPSSQTQQQLPATLRPGRARRPSNVSSNGRSSAATDSSPQIPSISLPGTTERSIPNNSSRTNGTSSIASSSSLDVPTPVSSTSLGTPMAPSPVSAYPKTAYPEPETPETPRPNNQFAASPAPPVRLRNNTALAVEPSSSTRREPNARVSFFDPANQATLDRLLSGDALRGDEFDEGAGEGEVAEEAAQAMLNNIEEMLEGYEWAAGEMFGTGRGTTDQIEARLVGELMALEKANIHSFIESDDRVNVVLKYLDDALGELDGMDSIISSYKIHLNAVSDDITYIQSQDRGLQVQTQNQRALLGELEELLQTVQVDREALLTLTQESLEKGVDRLETAASQLYKALLAGRDRDMAATMERLEEYRTYNTQFCKRLYDFLSIMFTAQSKLLLGDNNGISKPGRGKPSIGDHKLLESYLGRYAGLMLYLKEMDENMYGKLCAAYFSTASSLHSTQVKAFLVACNGLVKQKVEDDGDGFATAATPTAAGRAAAGVRRAGTVVRSPLERKERKGAADGDMHAADAFALALERIAPMVYSEEDFIADFLQINDAALTFADYMGLENYFRRQAARDAGLSQATMKLVRGAMDLIFGFLPLELKSWLDNALEKDQLQIVGMIACIEKFLTDAEERGNAFFLEVLEKQHSRMKGIYERRVNEQIKSVEDTKLTSKKRSGPTQFIRYFPTYVGRVETQLVGANTLEIRQVVDASYDKIVQAMFSALKQMAKLDGEGEDKGQLNYHVILIENMHHFVAEMSQLDLGSVAAFLQRAQAIYDENLIAYVKLVLRRPFAKIIDYFDGVERVLKTTAPSEVASKSTYSKSALKKVIKEYSAKDVRKLIETLFKRVEKHFDEASETTTTKEASTSTGIASGTVLVGVWKVCEEELLRMTDYFVKRISQCYGSSGVTLEYTAADVEAAFKKHRITS